LHVLARDLKTGREKVIEIKSAVNVDDAAVQQMVEESVEHAFEDMAARRWVEARLKATELIAATRKGLADCSEELGPGREQTIEPAMHQVETALATENLETKTGDMARLQNACAALDEATRPLAELLMNKALDARLRKRGVIQ